VGNYLITTTDYDSTYNLINQTMTNKCVSKWLAGICGFLRCLLRDGRHGGGQALTNATSKRSAWLGTTLFRLAQWGGASDSTCGIGGIHSAKLALATRLSPSGPRTRWLLTTSSLNAISPAHNGAARRALSTQPPPQRNGRINLSVITNSSVDQRGEHRNFVLKGPSIMRT